MKNIYAIVGFHYEYAKHSAYLSRQETLHKKKNSGQKRMKFSDEIQIKRLHALIGKHCERLGYFGSLEDAEKAIKDNGYYVHEGGYYSTLCIEVVPFGQIDAYGEPLKWFKGHSTGDGWYDYEYRRCRSPQWAKNLFAFSR